MEQRIVLLIINDKETSDAVLLRTSRSDSQLEKLAHGIKFSFEKEKLFTWSYKDMFKKLGKYDGIEVLPMELCDVYL